MEVIETLRPAQSPSAIALGCFDGLHLGHQKVISGALHAAGLTSAVFTFDENPLRALGETPPPMLMTNEGKAEFLKKIGFCFHSAGHKKFAADIIFGSGAVDAAMRCFCGSSARHGVFL